MKCWSALEEKRFLQRQNSSKSSALSAGRHEQPLTDQAHLYMPLVCRFDEISNASNVKTAERPLATT